MVSHRHDARDASDYRGTSRYDRVMANDVRRLPIGQDFHQLRKLDRVRCNNRRTLAVCRQTRGPVAEFGVK